MNVVKEQSCGFGNNFESFYIPNVGNNKMNLKCSQYNFGNKNKWIQSATKSFEKKGTVGAFTKWCKQHGYSKVSQMCINEGKKSSSLKTRRRAIFAENIRGKRSSFGKVLNLKMLNNDIRYLKFV